jgi:lysine 6-dehydrogenase
MNVLVIGAGMMGKALAYDFAHSEGVDQVTIADLDENRAREVAASIGKKIVPKKLDVNTQGELLALMHASHVAVGATSYNHNLLLTKAAIEAKVHFCDLGGNMDVVDSQISLDGAAKRANICVFPNCGLAPGMACVIAAGGAMKFSELDTIQIRVGGLPQHPVPPLNYQLVFSVEGLINEYLEPAEVIRNGELRQVASMMDIEQLTFPQPFGTLEAFNTSGGISTLTRMFKGKAGELDYKTIRYPGHCEKFKTLLDLGFASTEPIVVGNTVRTARELFEELLRRKLPSNGPDVVLMRVTLSGTMNKGKKTLVYEMIDYYDSRSAMTSMMRTTAFPTSIIAQMIVRGDVTARGVLPPEQCVPLDPFIRELQQRNINIHETIT